MIRCSINTRLDSELGAVATLTINQALQYPQINQVLQYINDSNVDVHAW